MVARACYLPCLLLLVLYAQAGDTCCKGLEGYKLAVCSAKEVDCDGKKGSALISCLKGCVPCYGNETSPSSQRCYEQYLCCSDHTTKARKNKCLREAFCAGMTGDRLERCMWRAKCGRKQPRDPEHCPTVQKICMVENFTNCDCVNARLFNCEISCDLAGVCCHEPHSDSSTVCPTFGSFLSSASTANQRSADTDLQKKRLWGGSKRFRRKRKGRKTMTTTTTTPTTPQYDSDDSDNTIDDDTTEDFEFCTCNKTIGPYYPDMFLHTVMQNWSYITDPLAARRPDVRKKLEMATGHIAK